jgi:peptidylamidoglycolate lyase
MPGDFKVHAALASLTLAAFVTAYSPAFAQTAEKGGMDETGPYRVVENWFKPGVAHWRRPVTSVAFDRPGRVFIASADEDAAPPGAIFIGADGVPENMRGAAPKTDPMHLHEIMVLNADGKAIEDWSQWNDLIVLPHNVLFNPYDKERNLWVIDREGHQILKFTNDGKKLLLKIGEKGVSGTDHTHFNRPAGIAFLPDGSFYVADGYSNTRVIKLDKDGKFQLEWGTKGTGPGQFDLVHSVAVDGQGRVFVADRSNHRIQIFDAAGKFLDQWPNVRHPTFLTVSNDNKSVWVASGIEDRMVKYDMNGKLQTYWGAPGNFAATLYNPHGFSVDPAGDLYIADSFNNRVQKLVPRADGDKSRLVDPPFVFKTP